MAFQFPASPAVNQTFTPVAGVTYRWSGTAWHLLAGPGSFITQADADTRYVNVDEVANTTNRIINGKFAIDQRNAGAFVAATTGGIYGMDRWKIFASASGGAFRMMRSGDALPAGQYSALVQVTTVDAAPAAGAYYLFQQTVEGVNVADLAFGTAGAQPFVFTCNLESTVSGTLAIAFLNSVINRYYVVLVPLTANVRVPVSIVVPGDTTGTWLADNGIGLTVRFTLNAGSNYTAPATNVWAAGEKFTAAGATNFVGSLTSLYVENVRLYKGSVDFGPDRRLYAEELALCQRYFQQVNAGVPGSGSMFRGPIVGSNFFWMPFSVQMRAVPTMSIGTPVYGSASGAAMGSAQPSGAEVSFTTSVQNGNVIIPWTASAEL